MPEVAHQILVAVAVVVLQQVAAVVQVVMVSLSFVIHQHIFQDIPQVVQPYRLKMDTGYIAGLPAALSYLES